MEFVANSLIRSDAVLKTHTYPGYHDFKSSAALSTLKNSSASNTAKTRAQSTLTTMRADFTKGIDLQKMNLPSLKSGTIQFIPGFSVISECHCSPGLGRVARVANGRLAMEQKIANQAKAIQDQGKIPHILAIGTGTLGQEVHLIRSLQKAGVHEFKLDLIDRSYKDVNPEINFGLDNDGKNILADQIVEIITSGFGYKISMGAKKVDSCQLMTQPFTTAINQNALPTSGKLEIRFFGSVEDYKANVSKASAKKPGTRANLVYDIDLCHNLADKNSIISDALNLTEKDAHYLSLAVYNNEEAHAPEIETRTRANGNWGPSDFQTVSQLI